MDECIQDLLKSFKLEQYTTLFLSNGFDDVSVIRGIDRKDLQLMGITCHKKISEILELLNHLNEAFAMYMSVHEVYSRPSKEDLLSYFAEKFERQGLFPSGEECVHAVQEKLDKEAITLPVHNLQMYINKEGQYSTRREYKMLIARYAQELFLPDQSVACALKIIHDVSREKTPSKPPKPRFRPVFNQLTGKLVWLNGQGDPYYENLNDTTYIYEFLNKLSSPTRRDAEHLQTGITRKFDDIHKQPQARSSPTDKKSGNIQPVKKKTFFKKFKHNIFGRSNSSLDNFLGSTKRSSDSCNSRTTLFKNWSKKEKKCFERTRSYSAPPPSKQVQLTGFLRPADQLTASIRSDTSRFAACSGTDNTYSKVFNSWNTSQSSRPSVPFSSPSAAPW